MRLTDTFSSTVVVTIPILMLAGAAELQRLADAVTKQIGEGGQNFLRMSAVYLKEITSVDTANMSVFQYLILQMRSMFRYARSLRPGSTLGTVFILPWAWFMVLIFACVCEVLCLLSLAGVQLQPTALIVYSVIAVGSMVALLIVTPAVRTLFVAPIIGFNEFIRTMSEKPDRDLLESLLQSLPRAAEMDLVNSDNANAWAERIKSILAEHEAENIDGDDTATDRLRQSQLRPTTLFAVQSSRRSRSPRWLTRVVLPRRVSVMAFKFRCSMSPTQNRIVPNVRFRDIRLSAGARGLAEPMSTVETARRGWKLRERGALPSTPHAVRASELNKPSCTNQEFLMLHDVVSPHRHRRQYRSCCPHGWRCCIAAFATPG
jgi:hypothetical protein